MKLGAMVGYWQAGPSDPTELVQEAEGLGYESAWFAEAYGSDCFSPLCWAGARTSRIKLGTAVMQLSARTPASVAMTAMTIDHLTGGRLILGVGVSGPQVVEGWYGQPFPRPLARTREFIEVVRTMLRREGPLEFDGRHYQLPLRGGSGLGKPLKLITRPLRSEIPIFLGAEGPKNVALSAEIADGWLPLYVSPERFHIYDESLAKRKPGFEIAATVTVVVNDDLSQAFLPVKMALSFYIGGMGARDQNFHLNLFRRMGFGEMAERVQELFLSGKRAEAIAAIPDAVADELALCGPPERITDRLQRWKNSPITTLIVATADPSALRVVAEAVL